MTARAIPWVLAAFFWAPIAFAGGLGFAPLIVLMTVAALFTARDHTIRAYSALLAVGFGYVALSSIWSPAQTPLIEFNPAENAYAIKATALRVGLVAFLSSIVVAAALRAPAESAGRYMTWMAIAFALQLVTIIVLAVDQGAVLDLFAPMMSNRAEGVQNIGRNAVVAGMAACLLAAQIRVWGAERGGWIRFAPPVLIVVTALLIVRLDTVASVMGLMAALVAFYVFPLLGRMVWRVLGVLTALYIVAAPFLYSGLIAIVGDAKSSFPASAWWRIDIWDQTLGFIREKPLLGWGLDALREFDAVWESGRWEGYPVIPGHPHNMLLHVWVETGLVGALFAGLATALLGWRLSNLTSLSAAGAGAAAAIWFFVIVVCSFSFSMWNEWWWALVGLSAACVVLIDRQASVAPATGSGLGDRV